MAYTPQNFEDGKVLKAEELNHIEAGIAEIEKNLKEKQPAGNYIETETDPTVPSWAKQPTKPTYTANEVGARPATWMPSASEVGADPSGTAETKVSNHNTDTEAHNDIRLLLTELITQVNSFLDVDDTTRDQLSEILRDIDANKTSIESITSGKVNVTDIINNLTTNVANKPLSAAQGVALKGLIDALQTALNNHIADGTAHITAAERTAWNNKQPAGNYATKEELPTKTSQLTDDVGFAKQEEVDSLSEEIADLSLGMGEDGRLYLLNGGVAQGNGIELPSGATGDVIGNIGEGNVLLLSGDIPDGTYSAVYETNDGRTINIGNFVLDTNVYYSITNNLTNCTNSNSAKAVVEGGSYSATITANDGYKLSSVVVTMGGTDITSSAVSGGNISITNVTGNIVITAIAVEDVPSYTNLAKNFTTGRLRGTGEIDPTVTAAKVCEDYIPFTKGTVVRVKGFGALTDYNIVHYNSTKTVSNVGIANVTTAYNTYSYDSDTGVVTMESIHNTPHFMRVSGILTGTTDDVIITVNEPIA